jgi:hypothetical protein
MADVLERDLGMLKMILSDFSEADMLKRPAPSANHAAWQLGHLIASEAGMVGAAAPDAMPPLPAGFAERFSKETARNDTPGSFLSKNELLSQFDKVRSATAKWARGLTPAQMDAAAPEAFRQFVPTIGHLALILPCHTQMHVGQFQVIRRALGKPVLF